MNKLRIGILGCASIATRSIAPAIQIHSDFQLVAFAGRNIEKTTETATKFGCLASSSYQDLIDRDDIDVVYIPLPNALHEEWVIKSLNSGKHVICEKSLGCNFNEVQAMIEAARINQKLLFENFQFRFHSQHQFIKGMLSNNEIGEIRSFRSSFGFPPFPDLNNIRYQKLLGGGALLDAGAYTIKATQFILGNNFVVMASNLNISKENDVDIFGGIYMQNSQGQFAELSFGFDNYYQCNYEIWGSKGKLTANRAFTASPGIMPTVIIEKQGFNEILELPSDNHFSNMLTHVAQCIQTGNFEPENEQNLLQAYNLEQTRIKSVQTIY